MSKQRLHEVSLFYVFWLFCRHCGADLFSFFLLFFFLYAADRIRMDPAQQQRVVKNYRAQPPALKRAKRGRPRKDAAPPHYEDTREEQSQDEEPQLCQLCMDHILRMSEHKSLKVCAAFSPLLLTLSLYLNVYMICRNLLPYTQSQRSKCSSI